MKVADLTMEEFEALVRRTVEDVLAERDDDDEDQLEMREEFVEELERRLASDEPGVSLDEMARELGLS